jgi:DNA-binding NarL/FixJ family response regulator
MEGEIGVSMKRVVLVIARQALMREGLMRLLQDMPGVQSQVGAESISAARPILAREGPDVVVLATEREGARTAQETLTAYRLVAGPGSARIKGSEDVAVYVSEQVSPLEVQGLLALLGPSANAGAHP